MPIRDPDSQPIDPARAVTALGFYFGFAFLIPWGTILYLSLTHGFPGTGDALAELQIPFYAAMLAGPTTGAIVVALLYGGMSGLRRLLGGLTRWNAGVPESAAAILVVPVSALVVLLTLSLISPAYTPGLFGPAHLAAPILMGVVGGTMAGLFEEIGWTGVATPLLLRRMSIIRAALILGLIHAIWHLMAGYWSEGTRFGGLYPLYFVTAWVFPIIALRLLIVWLFTRTGSILIAVVTHAANTGGLILLWPTQTTPAQDVTWTAVFSVVLLTVVLIVTRRMQPAR